MLRAYVVAETAEERSEVCSRLQEAVSIESSDLEYIPHIDFRPTSTQELRFQERPDLIFVGPETLLKDATVLRGIVESFPSTPVLALVNESSDRFSTVEQYIRLGATDALRLDAPAKELLRRIIVLSRRNPQSSGGRLIAIDSGKGGVGVTTVAAALGDAFSRLGKSVCILDLDFETQDLSRFLQTKPFVNEPLGQVLYGSRALSEELVEQASIPLWDEEGFGSLCVIPPVPDSDDLYPGTAAARTFMSLFEILDAKHEIVLVDMAGVKGALARAIYRFADDIVFVVSNDPASVYASIDQVAGKSLEAGADAKIHLLENRQSSVGIDSQTLHREMKRALRDYEVNVSSLSIPFCAKGSKWPASGESFAGLANRSARQTIFSLSREILGEETATQAQKFSQLLTLVKKRIQKSANVQQLPVAATQPPQIGLAKQIETSQTGAARLGLEKKLALPGGDENQTTPKASEQVISVSKPVFSPKGDGDEITN